MGEVGLPWWVGKRMGLAGYVGELGEGGALSVDGDETSRAVDVVGEF